MTIPPLSPASSASSASSVSASTEQPPAAPPVDFVLAGRAVSTGAHIAGLIAAAQLDTVGTPRKLPADLFPGVDPAVVQEIWDRALVVGVRAGQLMTAPRFNRDRLARLQGELAEAGHAAMGGMVGRSRVVAERAPEWHPADDEIGREH
jgi:hypothetical protein